MTTITVGFYREAWLVLAEGGWWSLMDIVERLPECCEVDRPSNRLWIMENRHGYVISRGEGKAREYAIIDDCVIPYGIPLARLKQAMAAAE